MTLKFICVVVCKFSQDSIPTHYAFSIARRPEEAFEWYIFLRALSGHNEWEVFELCLCIDFPILLFSTSAYSTDGDKECISHSDNYEDGCDKTKAKTV